MRYSASKQPIHPGEHIRAEIIAPLGLSVSEAAKALRVTRPTLSALLNQRSALSAEMAIRIEKAFGVPMERLMELQYGYDIAAARDRAGEIDVPRFKSTIKPDVQPGLF